MKFDENDKMMIYEKYLIHKGKQIKFPNHTRIYYNIMLMPIWFMGMAGPILNSSMMLLIGNLIH